MKSERETPSYGAHGYVKTREEFPGRRMATRRAREERPGRRMATRRAREERLATGCAAT